MFDVQTAGAVAAGEVVTPLPISIEGLRVAPGQTVLSSQTTGDAATILTAQVSGGRVRMPSALRDFGASDATVVDTTAEASQRLAVGEACWATLFAVQHRNAGSVSLIWLVGDSAVEANAVRLTAADAKTKLGLDDYATLAICGDIRYTRTSDTVLDYAVSDSRRPGYIDDSRKVELLVDSTDLSGAGFEPAGHLDFPVDLTGYSGVTPGNLAVDGATLPKFPLGGRIDELEYIPGLDGVGASADITLKAQIDGVEVTGSDLQITLATAGLGDAPPKSQPTAANIFVPGDGLDIEVDAVAAAFTAGSGILRVHLSKVTGSR